MPGTIVLQRVLVRDMPDRSRVVATLRIDHLQGNAHPYFSATAEVFEPHGTWSGAAQSRNGREPDCGGCVHEEILRAFPGAAPFVELHLSDWPSGAPMHALANAWYFYSGRAEAYERDSPHYGPAYVARAGTGRERAARTLRCDVRALPLKADAREFAEFVRAQEFRWAREAREAYELLSSMPDTTDLRGYDWRGQACERRALPAWLTGTRADVKVDV